MTCFHPVKGVRFPDGKVKFVAHGGIHRPVEVACGQCVGCRLERSRNWAVRCMHESQLHEHNSFVTLTYDDAHLHSISLEYRDFQLFMKRLRKSKGSVRFYMCGEYGDDFGRPHFHACLFGCFFADREHFRRMPSGSSIYTSKELSELWPYGFSSIGDVTFESAAYVARYVMKKITGSDSDGHYEAVDGNTGEIVQRTPEFNRMSLKPGIGADWFLRYNREVYGPELRDYVVVRGVKCKPPRYYDRLLEKYDGLSREELAYRRGLRADSVADDSTPARLLVREAVAKARLSFKTRSIT